MAQNSEIWQIMIPDFQVLAKRERLHPGVARPKKMTKQLRMTKQQKTKSNIINKTKNA